MGSSPTRGSSFFLGKVTALGVLCCFALFVCLTLLASFFLPSHLSFKNMYVHAHIIHYIHVRRLYIDYETDKHVWPSSYQEAEGSADTVQEGRGLPLHSACTTGGYWKYSAARVKVLCVKCVIIDCSVSACVIIDCSVSQTIRIKRKRKGACKVQSTTSSVGVFQQSNCTLPKQNSEL